MKLLDTTFLVDYWAGEEGTHSFLERHEEAETFVTTTINLKEIAVGRALQGHLDPQEISVTFGWVEVLSFESEHAFEAAGIEAALHADPEVNRDRINTLAGDVLIAAVASVTGAAVVTRKVDDFEKLGEVPVESY